VRQAGRDREGDETGKSFEQGGTMRYRYCCLFLIMVFSLLQVSCGSQAGAPGSEGDTGIKINAVVTPSYNASSSYSVDVFQDLCDPGPPPVFEVFTDHSAVVDITATPVNPLLDIQPGDLYVEEYTVDFYRSSDSVGAPPILSDRRFMSFTIPAPAPGGEVTVSATVILIDLPRKEQYANDMLSGQYTSALSGIAFINNYTAVYTFYGKNEFGTHFSFTATTNFQIGSFDYCV
jgi:hypothetical protein